MPDGSILSVSLDTGHTRSYALRSTQNLDTSWAVRLVRERSVYSVSCEPDGTDEHVLNLRWAVLYCELQVEVQALL